MGQNTSKSKVFWKPKVLLVDGVNPSEKYWSEKIFETTTYRLYVKLENPKDGRLGNLKEH